MAILLPDNDFQSIRLKNKYFWRKFLFNASGLLSVFNVAAFWPCPDVREFVLQIWNCLSSALIRRMAEGHGSTGWVSGAVVSLKRARPSELLVYITLPWLPPKDTLESYALEFIEGHNEKLSYDITW